jgi:hypothetical protein
LAVPGSCLGHRVEDRAEGHDQRQKNVEEALRNLAM